MKHLLPIWVLGFLLLNGCGESKENTPQPLIQTRPAPPLVQCSEQNPCASTGSCFHTPFEGERQVAASLALGFQDSGYFQKPLQTALSSSLMNLSGEATWNSVLSWGVPVFKVATPSSANPCRYYAPLGDAPGDLQKKWQSFQHKSAGRGLLGLFTSQTVRNGNGDVSLVDPAILLREDSQRWTLVHESHHYLYARARINQRPYLFDSELLQKIRQRRNQVQRQKQRLENKPGEGLANKLLNSYRRIFELNLELDRRGPLEEFAIESQLLDSWSQNFLTLIHPESDLRNAVAYMSTNQSRVLGTYRQLRKSVKALKDLSQEKGWTTKTEAQKLVKDILELIQFINGKMELAYGLTHSSGQGQTSGFPPRPDQGPYDNVLGPKSHYDPEIYLERDQLMSDL